MSLNKSTPPSYEEDSPMTDVPRPKTQPSDFLLSPSSISKRLFCSEYSFSDELDYSPMYSGIGSSAHLDRDFPSTPDSFHSNIRDHIFRRRDQHFGESQPWYKSNFITLYDSQKLAEDDVVLLSVVGKGHIDTRKLVNKAIRIENRDKPGLKVYQVSGTELAANNVSIANAAEVIRTVLPEKTQSLLESMYLEESTFGEGEYWVWVMVPDISMERAISYKSIFTAKMEELDKTGDADVEKTDQTFHDTVEKQDEDMDDRVKLRDGARTMHTARKSPVGSPDRRSFTRGIAQHTHKKASKPSKQTYEANSEDDEDDDDDEDIPAIAKPKRTVAFTTPEPRPRRNVRTRHAIASKTQNAGSSSRTASVPNPEPSATVKYGKGPLPGGLWKLKEVLDYRWAKDKNGNLLKNKAGNPFLEYLVKWDGKGKKGEIWDEDQYDTWEPAKNFTRPKVLTEFWESIGDDEPTVPGKEKSTGGSRK